MSKQLANPTVCSWESFGVNFISFHVCGLFQKREYCSKATCYAYVVPLRNKLLKESDTHVSYAQKSLSDLDLFAVAERLTSVTDIIQVGLQLGMKEYHVEGAISSSGGSPAHKMLKKWRDSVGPPTKAWRDLRRALEACKLDRIVHEVLDP